MAKPVIIVESPTKIKTLKKYLGDKYIVAATAGHIRDLPQKELGIDVENNFEAKYINIKEKSNVISKLKKQAADAREIYLGPDPDREGEAIAFHTADILKNNRTFYRILIHELTQKGIDNALKNPSRLDENKFESQQARRKLDRLVGYQISPLLWKKVQRNLSAGRVQSVAVRIICDREREIRAFEPEEYWSITVELKSETPPVFNASLSKINKKKAVVKNGEQAEKIVRELENASFKVDDVKKKQIKRNPLPPFITSKLQQDAINRLKFSARKTMVVAQQLYEGIEIGVGGPEGLITYMRTDSTRIAADAANEALDLIRDRFGSEYALSKPRFFKNKNKSQDAHEAIRPTSVKNTPENIKPYLSEDQFKLYDLIWKRFVASQMAQALIDQKTVSIRAGEKYLFSVAGSSVAFPGFMTVYAASDPKSDKEKQSLPPLSAGMPLEKMKTLPKQHFTKPPPRFSEASLVKELEENGIGRPSTYASILSTIREKGYVNLDKRYFVPSELGFVVNDLLVHSFPDILDIDFTADMENQLDSIEKGEKNAVDVLSEFYSSFKQRLDTAGENMLNVKGVGIRTDLECPVCGKPLNIKIGKNGSFIACTGYPDCSFTSNYKRDEKGNIEIIKTTTDDTKVKDCEKCGRPMVVKEGRYGSFLACTGYPDCTYTESVDGKSNQKDTGVPCPEENCSGTIVEKKSKRGKTFFGCSRYPECTFASWNRPVNEKCPECGAPYLVTKVTKKEGEIVKCPAKECKYQRKSAGDPKEG